MGESTVTVTRLRSDMGSFVQSPLGAFDSEAVAPPEFSAVVSSVFVNPSDSRFKFGVCQVTDTSAGNNGYTRIIFDYDTGNEPPLASWANYYHIGQTSGASWRPSDNGVALVCEPTTGGLGDQFWGGTNAIVLGSGLVYEYHVEIDRVAVVNVNQTGLYVNTGEFPATTPPAFQQGEAVTLQLTP